MKVLFFLFSIIATITPLMAFYSNNNVLVARGGYFNTNKQNTIKLQNFANIKSGFAEAGLITSHYFHFHDFNVNNQFRVFNTESFYYNNSSNNNTKLYLDELYISSYLLNIKFGLGRKKVATQFAYFYPLLDTMATQSNSYLNYFDRKIEKSGQDLLDMEINSNYGNFYIAYVPRFTENSSNFLEKPYLSSKNAKIFVKLSKSFIATSTDLALIAENNNTNNTMGLAVNQNIGDNAIIYSELKASDNNNFKNNYTAQITYPIDYTIGINYTLQNGINLLVEYYGNNYKYTQAQYLNMLNKFNNTAPYLYNNYTEIKRDYFSIRIAEIPLPFKTEIGSSINLNDGGVIVFSSIEADINDNLKIYNDINYFFQNKYSETNNIPYKFSALVSLKYFL